MPRVSTSDFSSRQNSSPSMPGITTSSTITSGGSARISSRASAAPAASTTSMSKTSKVVRNSALRPASSSTSKTRTLSPPFYAKYRQGSELA